MTTYSKEWHYEYCMGEVECKHGDPECPHNHFLKNEPCKCPTQPNTTPIKDEIYSILRNQYDYSDDPEYTWEDLVSYNSLEEAAQTITTYIDNKILEARIDELRNIQTQYGGRYLAVTYITGDPQTLEVRIDELSNQSKGTPND